MDVTEDFRATSRRDVEKTAGASLSEPRGLAATARQRSTQAERSAETRTKLVSATIDCLHEVGYSLATISLVSQRAGVSRGALTHQFPSKIDLMLAVVRYVYDSDAAQYRLLLGEKTPRESIADLPAAMWEVLSQPSAIAVIEIMLAARSDAALMGQLRLMQSQIEVEAGRAMVTRFKAAGVKDRSDGAAVHRMFVAAVRGLAIENLSMGKRADVAASIKVLSEVMTLLYPKLRS